MNSVAWPGHEHQGFLDTLSRGVSLTYSDGTRAPAAAAAPALSFAQDHLCLLRSCPRSSSHVGVTVSGQQPLPWGSDKMNVLEMEASKCYIWVQRWGDQWNIFLKTQVHPFNCGVMLQKSLFKGAWPLHGPCKVTVQGLTDLICSENKTPWLRSRLKHAEDRIKSNFNHKEPNDHLSPCFLISSCLSSNSYLIIKRD